MITKNKVFTDADMRKAIDKNSLAGVKRILDAGYDMSRQFHTDVMFHRDCVGKPALIWAVLSGRNSIVKLLIERGCNLNDRDRVGQSALHIAATQTSPAMLQLLIDAGADLNAAHVGMQTPLHYAVGADRDANCRLLVEAGAKPDFVPEEARRLFQPKYLTPFQLAVETGNLNVAAMLAENDPELFEQQTLDGRNLAQLCSSPEDKQKFLALRSEIAMRARMPAGAVCEGSAGPRRGVSVAL